MGDFRSDNRRSRFGGGRSEGRGGFRSNRGERPERRGGFRDRDSGGFQRRDMHDATCGTCGAACQVPFRPTGDRPVLCSNCFRKDGNSGSSQRRSFDSGSKPFAPQTSQAGISQEQFKQLNAKLDKILAFLENIEFEDDVAEEGDEDSEEADKEGEEGSE